MKKTFNPLKMLPVDKTVVFWSPVEGEDVLVRTGTIGDGSCFIHSVLHACSPDYVNMETEERMEYVKNLRAEMADGVDKKKWEEMGLIAKIPFQENVNDILANCYHFFANDDLAKGKSTRTVIKNLIKVENDLEFYQIIAELIPISDFEQLILPGAYDSTEEDNISACCEDIITRAVKHAQNREEMQELSAKKATYLCEIIQKFLGEVLKEAEDSAYIEYIKSLNDSGEDIDTYTTSLISDKFDRDIYFLDAKTRMPYNNASTTENLRKRKSIVILWVGKSHYEIVGRLLPGNKIQREFEANDPLIRKLYTFLINPHKASVSYPELIPYLPKNNRQSLPRNVGVSPTTRGTPPQPPTIKSGG